MLLPPTKKGISSKKWAARKKFQFRHVIQYLVGALFSSLSKMLKLHPKAFTLVKKSLEMGNPTQTVWPSETIPMNSRLWAGAFWNYSFFQFNRNFYFPYWAMRQYDPSDVAFIPRSHNVMSMNQTQRNWLSISFPGKKNEVSVDAAVALMPEPDSYTIEFALLIKGNIIRAHDEVDKIKFSILDHSLLEIRWHSRRILIEAKQNGVQVDVSGGDIIVSIRPFNMEGPALLYKLNVSEKKSQVSGDVNITWSNQPDTYCLSDYADGDALKSLARVIKDKESYSKKKSFVKDKMGLCTASFYFKSQNQNSFFIADKTRVDLPSPLVEGLSSKNGEYQSGEIWNKWFNEAMSVELPGKCNKAFNYAKNHLLTLWDYDSVTPGSYTYHHFWIRDAAIMMNAYLILGTTKAIRPMLKHFKGYVKRNGLFHTQAGEWDANGQALWVIAQYIKRSGDVTFLKEFARPLRRMIKWIIKQTQKYNGVIPPGFSAEHLGVADWYLWDNFWTLGGLQEIHQYVKDDKLKRSMKTQYERLHEHLFHYLKGYKYYPAALGRRKDAGIIGSVSAIYPLNLKEYYNERMYKTINIIYEKYFFKGGFFQENIHSGINPYLSLQVAEAFLHFGNTKRAFNILKDILDRAQFGFTFPEAIHPNTGGGCMGDGFHGWAFAEIVILIRNLFFLELPDKNILLAGIPEKWVKKNWHIQNMLTPLGRLDLSFKSGELTITGLQDDACFCIALPFGFSITQIEGASFNEREVVWHEKKSLQSLVDKQLFEVTASGDSLKLKIEN